MTPNQMTPNQMTPERAVFPYSAEERRAFDMVFAAQMTPQPQFDKAIEAAHYYIYQRRQLFGEKPDEQCGQLDDISNLLQQIIEGVDRLYRK